MAKRKPSRAKKQPEKIRPGRQAKKAVEAKREYKRGLKKDPLPDEKHSKKLSKDAQHYICSLLAQGYSTPVIAQMVYEEYGVECTDENVRHNYRHSPIWKPVIEAYAKDLREKVLEHPLAQKMTRLNILQEAINECLRERVFKKNKYGTFKQKYPKAIAQLIREARTEVEGSDVGNALRDLAQVFLPEKDDPEAEG